MNFSLTSEQGILRDSVTGFLARHRASHPPQSGAGATAATRIELWSRLASELGLFGATIPAEAGGLGGGSTETMIIMEALGAALVCECYLPTIVIGGGLLKRSSALIAAPALQDVISGRMRIAFAHGEGGAGAADLKLSTMAVPAGQGWQLSGRKSVVLALPLSTHVLVTADIGPERQEVAAFLLPADHPGLHREDYVAIDGQPAANLVLDRAVADHACRITGPGEGAAMVAQVIDEANAALGAEAVGLMQEMIAQTAAYMHQRKQFGQALVVFQALQHRLADMKIELEQARSMALMATMALTDSDQGRRGAAVSAMKLQICQSLRYVSQQSIQLHGGMGITDELAIGRYFKRALAIMASFGSEDDHYRRYDALALRATG